MEIQKIFSNIEDQEEKLYSILLSEPEIELFSEFQKEFNSKAQKDETKLKLGDRMSIWGYKHLNNQKGRDEARETWKTGKMGKGQRASVMAGFGSAAANMSINKSMEYGNTPVAAAKGALISAGIGAAEGYLASKGIDAYRKHTIKKNPKAYEKDIDRINVAEGKMTKEEFAKKHYKK